MCFWRTPDNSNNTNVAQDTTARLFFSWTSNNSSTIAHGLGCERHTSQAPLRKRRINTKTCFFYEISEFKQNYRYSINYRKTCFVIQNHTIQSTPTQHKTLPHVCFPQRQTTEAQLPKRKRQTETIVVFYERREFKQNYHCASTVWVVNVRQSKHHRGNAKEY